MSALKFILALCLATAVNCRKQAEPCMPKSDLDGYSTIELNRMGLENGELRFCFQQSEKLHCRGVNPSTGKHHDRPEHAAKPEARVLQEQFTRGIMQEQSVEICLARGDCNQVTWKGFRSPSDDYSPDVAVSADAAMFAIPANLLGVLKTQIRRLPDGRLISALNLKGWPVFIGSHLIDQWADCAGPCSEGQIITIKTGKVIAPLGAGIFMDGLTPVEISNDVWVLNDGYGMNLIFQNLRTGKIIKNIELNRFFTKETLEYSGQPYANALFKEPSGNLLLVYSGIFTGNVLLFSPQGEFIKRMEPPACGNNQ